MRRFLIFLVIFIFCFILFGDVFVDRFDDGVIDSTVWSIQRTSNTEIVETGGVCRMRVNYGGCDGRRVCFVTKRMKKSVIGDFEAMVDFDILEHGDGDITPFMMIANNDCVRQRLSVSWAAHYGRFTYRCERIDTTEADTVWTIISSAATVDTSGRMRMSREGDWFHFYTWDGFFGWMVLDSIEMDMAKTWISLHVQNQGTHEAIDAAVDSFWLQYDSLYYSECEPPEPEKQCMNETASILLTDGEGVYPESIELEVDGVEYTTADPEVDFIGSTLTFDPGGIWGDGETHTFCLLHVEDIIGNAWVEDTCWNFITDITPPSISDLVPNPGDTVYDYTPFVSCRIVDTWHPLDLTQTSIEIGFLNFFLDDPRLEWTGTHANIDMDDIGVPLDVGDTVEICVHATDDIPFCPPNDTIFCWSFMTGDSIRPEIGSNFPTDSIISSCDDQSIDIIVTDNTVLDTSSIEIEAGGNTYSFPSQMDYFGDTLTFYPDLAWQNGFNEICITSLSDKWDNEYPSLPHCFNVLIDLEGPVFDNLSPANGEIVSTTAPLISATVSDSIGVVLPDSFVVTFQDTIIFNVDSSSELIDFTAGTLSFDSETAGLHFSGGTVVEVCLGAFDSPDLCQPNLGERCWDFEIASGGPTASEIVPENNMHTSCADQQIRILIEDEDSINWDNLVLEVAGTNYEMSMPEMSFSGDTLIFTPSDLFNHAQDVDVRIVNAQDMLDNPLSEPFSFVFTVDLEAPYAEMIDPLPGQIVRNRMPTIQIRVDDGLTQIYPDSAIISVTDSSFAMDHPAFSFNPIDDGVSGIFELVLANTDLRLVSGDSIIVTLSTFCDDPDLCAHNCSDSSWIFRMESNRACKASPNPFTPNNDNYNERIWFEYPGQDLDNAEIVIFNIRGVEVFKSSVDASTASFFEPRSWSGKDSKGVKLPPGQYIYIISVKDEVICEGSITLVR